jgi:hypothetical protein
MSPPPFRTARLLLCEGYDDHRFLTNLIRAHNVGAYDVRAVEDIGAVAGNTGFEEALKAAVVVSGFKTHVTRVVLVADADTQYNATFTNICTQIRNANADPDVANRFPIPGREYALSGGHPRVAIVLLPRQQAAGSLETLLLEAMAAIPAWAPVLKCVEDACNCSGANTWPREKRDKTKVRTAIALRYRQRPGLTVHTLWPDHDALIPIASPAFAPLAGFLRGV